MKNEFEPATYVRFMINVGILIIITCSLLYWPSEVLAWNFSEHRELGEEAYRESCKRLKTSYAKNEELAILKSVLCSDVKAKSSNYGTLTALAGDHIKSPEDFENISGEKQSISLSNYGFLALENHDHFWPRVNAVWKIYHSNAIEMAVDARRDWNNKLRTRATIKIEKAIRYSAFADHFLQDAFSMGHNGFSRVNSLQNDSLIFHDNWSKIGRFFRGKRFNLDDSIDIYTNDVMGGAVKDVADSCPAVMDGKITLKNKNIECDLDIWFALGDGKLNSENGENIENKKRIVNTNIYSIVSVILTFLEGDDRGYSNLADNSFPTAVESFIATSQLSSFVSQRPTHTNLYPDPVTKKCEIDNVGVYNKSNLCWFDLSNSLMEPVYPDVTISLGRIYFNNSDAFLSGFYLAYNPHGVFKFWPKNIRIYGLKSLDDKNAAYDEQGFNIVIPNLYNGTMISHEMDIAYVRLSRKENILNISPDRNGGYLGVNTNIDILRAKITLGAGYFLPTSDLKDSELKVQFMLGWSFGSLGGGPLSRWD